MKKFGLLTTLLFGGLLLSGCSFHVSVNDTSSTDENNETTENLQEDNNICGDIYDPICGVDGKVYQNGCFLNTAGVHRDSTMGVKNNECIKLSKEILYGEYILVRYNDNHSVKDNYNVGLTISEDGIFAKFCNGIGTSEYSLSGDTLQVNEMNQNLVACEGENGKWLMRAESEFNLKNATVVLSENTLTINTSIGAQYQFEKEE